MGVRIKNQRGVPQLRCWECGRAGTLEEVIDDRKPSQFDGVERHYVCSECGADDIYTVELDPAEAMDIVRWMFRHLEQSGAITVHDRNEVVLTLGAEI